MSGVEDLSPEFHKFLGFPWLLDKVPCRITGWQAMLCAQAAFCIFYGELGAERAHHDARPLLGIAKGYSRL